MLESTSIGGRRPDATCHRSKGRKVSTLLVKTAPPLCNSARTHRTAATSSATSTRAKGTGSERNSRPTQRLVGRCVARHGRRQWRCSRPPRIGDDGRPTGVSRFVPFSPFTAVPAATAFASSHLIASAAGNQAAIDVLTQLHDYRWPLAVATAPLIGLDLVRHRARRWSQMLESMVRQSTGHLPTKVTVPLSAGRARCAARRSSCRVVR